MIKKLLAGGLALGLSFSAMEEDAPIRGQYLGVNLTGQTAEEIQADNVRAEKAQQEADARIRHLTIDGIVNSEQYTPSFFGDDFKFAVKSDKYGIVRFDAVDPVYSKMILSKGDRVKISLVLDKDDVQRINDYTWNFRERNALEINGSRKF